MAPKKCFILLMGICLVALFFIFCGFRRSDWLDIFKEPISPEEPAELLASETEPHLQTILDRLIITVKTTKKYHKSRVNLILKTWMKTVKQNVYLVTDGEDKEFRRILGDHLIVADCGQEHSIDALCCKTEKEFERFISSSNKQWWCHIDDDVYLNVERLLKMLNEFKLTENLYLGRTSYNHSLSLTYKLKSESFRFITGATYCLSRPVAERLQKWMGSGKFVEECRMINRGEDVALGFLITNQLKIPLKTSQLFLNQYQYQYRTISTPLNITNQVTFSYYGSTVTPFGSIQPAFDLSEDKTRFFSIHCLLHPSDELCLGRPHSSTTLDDLNKTEF